MSFPPWFSSDLMIFGFMTIMINRLLLSSTKFAIWGSRVEGGGGFGIFLLVEVERHASHFCIHQIFEIPSGWQWLSVGTGLRGTRHVESKCKPAPRCPVFTSKTLRKTCSTSPKQSARAREGARFRPSDQLCWLDSYRTQPSASLCLCRHKCLPWWLFE